MRGGENPGLGLIASQSLLALFHHAAVERLKGPDIVRIELGKLVDLRSAGEMSTGVFNTIHVTLQKEEKIGTLPCRQKIAFWTSQWFALSSRIPNARLQSWSELAAIGLYWESSPTSRSQPVLA